eukprot:7822670-Lingulodinium_polyedra.AAC.1
MAVQRQQRSIRPDVQFSMAGACCNDIRGVSFVSCYGAVQGVEVSGASWASVHCQFRGCVLGGARE